MYKQFLSINDLIQIIWLYIHQNWLKKIKKDTKSFIPWSYYSYQQTIYARKKIRIQDLKFEIFFKIFFFKLLGGCGAPLGRGALSPGTMGTMGKSA